MSTVYYSLVSYNVYHTTESNTGHPRPAHLRAPLPHQTKKYQFNPYLGLYLWVLTFGLFFPGF